MDAYAINGQWVYVQVCPGDPKIDDLEPDFSQR